MDGWMDGWMDVAHGRRKSVRGAGVLWEAVGDGGGGDDAREGCEQRRAGRSRVVRRKWPRSLVPNCSSTHCAVRAKGQATTPALFMRMCSGRADLR
jgi:hypothetical protein